MGILRNALMATVAVGVLVGALFVLVPNEASATQIFLGSVSSFGSVTGGYGFDITANVKIASGEHIPVNFAKVFVADPTVTTTYSSTNGMLSSAVLCTATTGGTLAAATGSATIASITGANLKYATYSGYGYIPTTNGYGYVYTDTGSLRDFSSYGTAGYGYGYDEGGVTLQVTIHVAGCSGLSFGGAAFKQFLFQAGIGGDASTLFASTPTTAFVSNPAATAPNATPVTVSTFAASSTSASGDTTLYTFVLADTDSAGGGTNQNLAAGSLITVTFGGPGNGNLQFPITFTLKLEKDLPSGTVLDITVQDQGTSGSATQSITSTPFGITPASLSSYTTLAAGMYFQITLTPRNGQFVSATDTVSNTIDIVDFTIKIPSAYWTASGIGGTGQSSSFKLLEVSNDGSLSTISPTFTLVNGDGSVTFKFTINSFSSFAAIIINVTSGGTGGGSTTTTTPPGTNPTSGTTTSSTTTTGTTTTYATTTGSTTGATTTKRTGGGGSGSIPGLEIVGLLSALGVASLVAVRRRL